MSQYTDEQVERFIRDGFPKHAFDLLEAYDGDGGIGDLLLAIAEEVNQDGFALVETMQDEAVPLNSDVLLADREKVSGLSESYIVKVGSKQQRQAQLVARWRERGIPTPTAIKTTLLPMLGYSPDVLEVSRAALSDTNMTPFPSLPTIALGTTTVVFPHTDNALCGPMGAQVLLKITHASAEDLTFSLTCPDGSLTITKPSGLRGAVVAKDVALTSPRFSGKRGDGGWTFSVVNAGANIGSVDVGSKGLLVEGIGRDFVTKAEGRGASIFEWGVLVDPALMSSFAVDLKSVETAIRRWNPDHARAFIALKASNGSPYCIFDDPNSTLNWSVFA